MAAESRESSYAISRRELFDVWISTNNKAHKRDNIYSYILQKLFCKASEDSIRDVLKRKSDSIYKQFQQKWQESHSSKHNFTTKYCKWLEGYFTFKEVTKCLQKSSESKRVSGRPLKGFSDSSNVTKRRRVHSLLETNSSEALAYAVQMSLRSEGKRAAADIVKAVSTSAKVAHEIKATINQIPKLPVKLSPDQALASYIQKRFTRNQYISTHKEAKRQNADIYPCYDHLLAAKKRCYPEGITVTEVSAEISLQSILDHTIRRLVHVQKEVLLQADLCLGSTTSLIAFYKWGCDGAAGHARYKQRFQGEEQDAKFDDTFLFVISFVPLQLKVDDRAILWHNNRPSSTAFCRPVKIMFTKECEKLVRDEVGQIEKQIQNLVPTQVEIDGTVLTVRHQLQLTMIDGKICGYLTGTTSSRCYICKANPKAMNDLESHSKREIDKSALTYGLSSLHGWIKCFECILHIGYKLDIKKWQARGDDQAIVERRKKYIQDRLRKEMGLLVDIPKPGFGTTNDGNTARRFFLNPTLASTITGVDKQLIFRLSIILRTIASGLPINHEKFGEYCLETAKLYVAKYSWYFMPPTMHKILLHGAIVVKSSIVPIGQLSEEAQEAKHKECKRFRQDHTRKFSRKGTMEDLMHMLLISSDPLISSLLNQPTKKSGPLPTEVINMLECPYDPNESCRVYIK